MDLENRSWLEEFGHNLRRVLAFLVGDQRTAEDFPNYRAIPSEPWIEASSEDATIAPYAVEATKRSAEAAQSALSGVQEKCSTITTLILTLLPFSIAASGVSLLTLDRSPIAGGISFALSLIVIALLLTGAVRGFLGSGSVLVGGLNTRELSGKAPNVAQLQAGEADAWLLAADLAMQASRARTLDLFAARRAVIVALILAAFWIPLLFVARSTPPKDGKVTPHSLTASYQVPTEYRPAARHAPIRPLVVE